MSPYKNTLPEEWLSITKELIEEHPLSEFEIVDIVLESWDSIFASKLGKPDLKIGIDIFPKPQIMGFLLHELIPWELEARYKRDL